MQARKPGRPGDEGIWAHLVTAHNIAVGISRVENYDGLILEAVIVVDRLKQLKIADSRHINV
ncbi:hypothetical protein N9F34_04150 [Alphaproteobacteria bacterium]|nr:hypothetical protein [Alphaproteobacteria bacterium]